MKKIYRDIFKKKQWKQNIVKNSEKYRQWEKIYIEKIYIMDKKIQRQSKKQRQGEENIEIVKKVKKIYIERQWKKIVKKNTLEKYIQVVEKIGKQWKKY